MDQREDGALCALHLRLTPLEPGSVFPGAGNHIHAAFLDLLRQSDASLATSLHAENERRPFTIGLLRGFDHLIPEQLAQAEAKRQPVEVKPGQTYWLRITFLQTVISTVFTQSLIQQSQRLLLRLGEATFCVTRLIGTAAEGGEWVGSSTFAALSELSWQATLHLYFATPTAFSRGQKTWGKYLTVFPEPALVFGSLAHQWEAFAPPSLRLSARGCTPHEVEAWCADNVVVTRHRLETHYLPGARFGETGFQGDATFAVKGARHDTTARWLAPLAGLALYTGIGYKTAMGMGQSRWAREVHDGAQPTKGDTA